MKLASLREGGIPMIEIPEKLIPHSQVGNEKKFPLFICYKKESPKKSIFSVQRGIVVVGDMPPEVPVLR